MIDSFVEPLVSGLVISPRGTVSTSPIIEELVIIVAVLPSLNTNHHDATILTEPVNANSLSQVSVSSISCIVLFSGIETIISYVRTSHSTTHVHAVYERFVSISALEGESEVRIAVDAESESI